MQENCNREGTNDANEANDTNDRQGWKTLRIMEQQIKRSSGFKPRVKMRLSEIERVIKKHRIIIPPPSRQMLIRLCEDGTLETAGDRPTPMGWLVFEDSFLMWLRRLDNSGEVE